ncbi:MAG: hypothetical protein ABSC64_02350 [Candidatus Korobacteraceae bacterium]|jgi:hypothetical protein
MEEFELKDMYVREHQLRDLELTVAQAALNALLKKIGDLTDGEMTAEMLLAILKELRSEGGSSE